ncbi:sensor histidine kinase [Microbispora rosea]|uniref:sensor histidine kinase n=1 Tax=Microbispora rosea TaxID=58117 RepID=UPI003426CD03
MTRPSPAVLAAWGAVGLAVAVSAGDLWLAMPLHLPADAVNPWLHAVGVLARLSPVVVGTLIVVRRRGNRVGWTLVACGSLVVALQMCRIAAIVTVERLSPPEGPVLSVAYVLAAFPQVFFGFVYAWPVAIVLLFPDGRASSRATRWCLWGLAATCGLMGVLGVLSAPVTPAPYAGRRNVFFVPWLEPLGGAAFAVLWLVLWGLLVACVVIVVRRLRRATGERRLQLLWLAIAAVLPPLSLVGCVLALTGGFGMRYVDATVSTAQMLVVAAVFVAITRHGLYGIDRLINRTLVYACLTLLVTGVFLAVTVVTGMLVGGGSSWATALATAAAASVFFQARIAAQRFVDRRFAARKYAALNALRDYTGRLHRGEAELGDIERLLGQILGDSSLRVRFPGKGGWTTLNAEPAVLDEGPQRARSPVCFAGTQVAVIEHSMALTFAPELTRSVIREVAGTLAMARLQLQVEHQLEELKASRSRIVQAGYQERRRLERDLHDGAQQRLVALGISLRRLQHSLPEGAGILAPALDAAVGQVGEAIQDLRAIANGLRPARLDDGLRAALDDLAQNSPVPMAVRVPDLRMPAEVEAAAYFIACEAVTNAVKHAAPTRVIVQGTLGNGTLTMRVIDDGQGGAMADARGGGGLSGMADRARAHGGTVAISSRPGMGTTVEVMLPCA